MKKTSLFSSLNHRKMFPFFMILFFLLIMTCKKDHENENLNIQDSQQEGLTSEDMEYLDKIKQTNYSNYDVILENGQSVYKYLSENDPDFLKSIGFNINSISNIKSDAIKDYKMVLIARMLYMANVLSYRNGFKYSAIPGDPNSPAQVGLAYSYGQKDHKVRAVSPSNDDTCPEKIYGLDCSGFIFQLALSAGLTLSTNPVNNCSAAFEAQTSTWENAFKNSTDFKNLRIADLGQLDSSQIESGDIIYWNNINGVPKHIGIALSTYKGLGVFMSAGVPNDCLKNVTKLDRGPVQKALSYGLLKNWFVSCKGKCSWGVLRVTADMRYFPYNACSVSFSSRASYNSSKRGNYDFVIGSGVQMTGTFDFTNYEFKGTKCAAYACDPNTKLKLEIGIDLEDHTITDFYWSSADSVLKADGTYSYCKKTATSHALPLPGRYPNAYFSVSGTDALLYIKEVTYLSTDIEKDFEHPNGQLITVRLTKVNYDKDTRLEFSFYNKQ